MITGTVLLYCIVSDGIVYRLNMLLCKIYIHYFEESNKHDGCKL